MISPERLRFYPFFGGLSQGNLTALADIAEELQYNNGDSIFRENDEIDHIYFVEKGVVGLTVNIPVQHKAHPVADQLTNQMETDEIILCALGPGDVFGWSALVPPHQSTASAKALADCRILAFAREGLEMAFREDCRFGYLMMMKLGQVIRQRFQVLRMELLADKVESMAPAANS